MQKITTFLTFKKDAKAAVNFYVSVFKNSNLHSAMTMPGGDQLLHATFTLDGTDFMAMDGGPEFSFAQGVSLFVICQDQAEVDYFWEKLGADGGRPGQCGWLKDKYDMSWQIIPKRLGELMQGPDPTKSQKAMQAMLKMGKIDIAALEQAYNS